MYTCTVYMYTCTVYMYTSSVYTCSYTINIQYSGTSE